MTVEIQEEKPKRIYRCTQCGDETPRKMLTVKKVLFTGMGEAAKTTRSRVLGWLCVDCTKKDQEWNMPPIVKRGPARSVIEFGTEGEING